MPSDEDGWFKRWGKPMPFGPWSYADVEEMMKEMEKDFMELQKTVPGHLVRERRDEDGSVSKEIGPIVFGYSVTIGPDGKPVVKEFGNARRAPTKEWKEAITGAREPVVDVIVGDKDVRVIAELPGASKDDVRLNIRGRVLTISAEASGRNYHKDLEVPPGLDAKKARSSFKNGVLEVMMPKRRKASRRP